jgi:ribosomal protein S18 acetylase RimI-like enzyme
MADFPTSLVETAEQLPEASLGVAGGEALKQITDRGYEVCTGLTSEFAQAIAAMAREPSIREYCPKDSSERFTDLASAEHWLAKGRSMFLLLKRSDDGELNLAGYGWSGLGSNQHVPVGEITFALRIGQIGHGQGLATPFSRLILDASAVLYGAKNIWLETWASNAAAVHIYHKLGFVTADEEPGQRTLPNGQTMSDTRIYMLLPDSLLNS